MHKTLVILVLSTLSLSLSSQELVYNGYLKGMSTFSFITRDIPEPFMEAFGLDYSYHDGLIHNRFNFTYYGGDDWTFKVGMRNRIFYGFSVSHVEGFSDMITVDQGMVDMGILWVDASDVKAYTNFDRAYVNYERGEWQFRLGRQRINWGMNTVWNPNDLFNTYDYFDFDYEERPGSDAVLVRRYLNELESIEVGLSMDANDKLTAAALYKTNFRSYDMQFLGGYWKEDVALGMGFAGNIENSGIKGEATYFIPTTNDSAYSFVSSATYDYAFKNGFYVMLSFLYNSAAPKKLSFMDFTGFMAGGALVMSAKNPMPYRSVYFTQVSYPVSPLIFAGLATMVTHNANDVFLIPSVTFSLMNNLDLDLVGQLFFGEQPFSKEFGMTTSSVFVRLKWSY